MRCVVSCGSTSFPWLVFFFGALLWGSMIHKHTRRWMWQGSASDVFWYLQWLYCSLYFFAKDRVVILCVCLGTVQYWWISIGLVVVQLKAVFCPTVQYLSLFCEAFSWTILDSSRFPLFHSSQVFHQLVCPLTVVLLKICFSLTTLFSYPLFFSLFHAPLDVVVHFLVFLSSFRLKSFLSQFSPFVAQIKKLVIIESMYLRCLW